MDYRQALLAITLASGLAACASSPDYGLRYQDGSYYSPAGEGRGDYYVGAEPQRSYYYYDDFDLFFGGGYYGWYGSPFYSHGGYCSVRYRYCPRWAWGSSYGGTGFDLYFGSPWDPYWGRGYYPSQPYRRIQRPPADGRIRGPDWRQDPRPVESRGPRPRPAPSARDESDDSPFPAPRSNRRSPFPRPVERAPTPAPRPKSDDGDGN